MCKFMGKNRNVSIRSFNAAGVNVSFCDLNI